MLPVGTEAEGVECPYCPMGAPRISFASPPFPGALALRLVVAVLEGKKVPKETILPLPAVTNETIKFCKIGSWKEMNEGCNVFSPAFVPNAAWFASIVSPVTPEIGLNPNPAVDRLDLSI